MSWHGTELQMERPHSSTLMRSNVSAASFRWGMKKKLSCFSGKKMHVSLSLIENRLFSEGKKGLTWTELTTQKYHTSSGVSQMGILILRERELGLCEYPQEAEESNVQMAQKFVSLCTSILQVWCNNVSWFWSSVLFAFSICCSLKHFVRMPCFLCYRKFVHWVATMDIFFPYSWFVYWVVTNRLQEFLSMARKWISPWPWKV